MVIAGRAVITIGALQAARGHRPRPFRRIPFRPLGGRFYTYRARPPLKRPDCGPVNCSTLALEHLCEILLAPRSHSLRAGAGVRALLLSVLAARD
ncbi:unnamed protein product, partial [Iphiclides podalirius]